MPPKCSILFHATLFSIPSYYLIIHSRSTLSLIFFFSLVIHHATNYYYPIFARSFFHIPRASMCIVTLINHAYVKKIWKTLKRALMTLDKRMKIKILHWEMVKNDEYNFLKIKILNSYKHATFGLLNKCH